MLGCKRAKEYAIALEAEKRIRDLTINLMKEGLAQEKALLKAKYDDEVKAVKGTKTQQITIKKTTRAAIPNRSSRSRG